MVLRRAYLVIWLLSDAVSATRQWSTGWHFMPVTTTA